MAYCQHFLLPRVRMRSNVLLSACLRRELQIGRDMARAIYSARLAIFIHRITSAKRTREVRPAVGLLVRESSTQLLIYIIRWIHVSDTLHIFTDFQVSERLRLHGGPEFSDNYLIDYIIIT
jgi:hypothetical protein